MAIETNRTTYNTAGVYSGNIYSGTNDDVNLMFRDTVNGEMTLSQILASVSAHAISSHTGMSTDFATQYYNKARLDAYIADSVNGSTVGVSADVGGNANLGAHVADASIHQRVPKFVLRVAKGGQDYSSISAALAAIPTGGGDAPASDRWWRIEVSPGVYNEAVLLNKSFVEICGAGRETTRISYAGDYPLFVAASQVVVRNIAIVNSTPGGVVDRTAVMVSDEVFSAGVDHVLFSQCRISAAGDKVLWISSGSYAIQFDGCELSSTTRSPVYIEGSSGDFKDCYFGYNVAYFAGVIYGSGVKSTIVRCVSEGKLLQVMDASVEVKQTYALASGVIAMAHGDNGYSSVKWDGLGYASQIGVDGGLDISWIGNNYLYTGQSVAVDWQIEPSNPTQKSFLAGHHGISSSEDDPAWGGNPDFHFRRQISLSTADIGGDLLAIGDDSSTSGVSSTNALALYLGLDNYGGKFLRWIDGDVAGSELGYIDRNGVIHAPGFVGSGSGLTGVPVGSHSHNATDLTAGTIPNARFPATLPAMSGVNLTALNGSNVGSGTVPDARLSSNIARLNAQADFAGIVSVAGQFRRKGQRIDAMHEFASGSHTLDPTTHFLIWAHCADGNITINMPPDGVGVNLGVEFEIIVITNGGANTMTLVSPSGVSGAFRLNGSYVTGSKSLSTAVGSTVRLVKAYNEWRGYEMVP